MQRIHSYGSVGVISASRFTIADCMCCTRSYEVIAYPNPAMQASTSQGQEEGPDTQPDNPKAAWKVHLSDTPLCPLEQLMGMPHSPSTLDLHQAADCQL